MLPRHHHTGLPNHRVSIGLATPTEAAPDAASVRVFGFDSRSPLHRISLRSHDTRGDDVMEDRTLFDAINELTREEHEIWAKESHGQATDAERDRLRRLGVTLDQCWDLLHQRRARRAAGLNPDDAKVRDEKTVEGSIG